MITEHNLKSTLLFGGFIEKNSIFEKECPAFGCKMQVDFSAKKLIYPEAIKGR